MTHVQKTRSQPQTSGILRNAHSLPGLLLATAMLVASGSTAADFIIRSPAQNQVVTTPPVIVLKPTYGAPGRNFQLTLNGVVIDDLATYDSTRFTYIVAADRIQPLLREGRNQLRAVRFGFENNLLAGTDIEYFQFDTQGPRVIFDQVTVTGAGSLDVRGKAVDPSGAISVTINGQSLALDSAQQFSASLPLASEYRVIATDRLGQRSEKRYQDAGERLPRHVTATLSNAGLAPVGELVGEMVSSSRNELTAYVIAGNPVYKGRPGGLAGDVTFNATGLVFDDPVVTLTSRSGQLELGGTIPNVRVPMQGTSRQCLLFFCFNLPITGTAIIDVAGMTSGVDVDINGLQKITMDLQNFRTELGAFTFQSNWSGVPIVSGIIDDAVRKVLPGALQAALEQPLERVLNERFAGLNTSIAGSILDTPVTLELVPDTIRPTAQGLTLEASLAASVGEAVASRNLGYPVTTKRPTPTAGSLDLDAAVSVDTLNQILWKGQQAGMLDLGLCGRLIDLIDVFEVDRSLLNQLPGPSAEFLRRGTFTLQTLTVQSPEIAIPGYAGAMARVSLDGMKLRLDVDAQNVAWELWDPFGFTPGINAQSIEAEARIEADATILALPNNRIGIQIDNIPMIDLKITRITKFDRAGQLFNTTTDDFTLSTQVAWYNFLVGYVMPTVVPVLEASLGEIPLPTLAGFTLNIDRFEAGLSGQVGLEGRLSRDGGPDQGLFIPMPEVLAQFQRSCP